MFSSDLWGVALVGTVLFVAYKRLGAMLVRYSLRVINDANRRLGMDTEGDHGWRTSAPLDGVGAKVYSALFWAGWLGLAISPRLLNGAYYSLLEFTLIVGTLTLLFIVKAFLGPFRMEMLVDADRTYIAQRRWLGGSGPAILDESPRAGWFEVTKTGPRWSHLKYHAASGRKSVLS